MTYTLQEMIDVTMSSRDKTTPYYPMPKALPSFKFAFTECGEFVDAELRTDKTFARNNERIRDMHDEYAQIGYMLCTAIGQIQRGEPHHYLHTNDASQFSDTPHMNSSFDVYDVATYTVGAIKGIHSITESLYAWACAAYGYGYDPMELLKYNCAKVEAKWIPNVGKESEDK